jgi:hypothetical protein
LKFRAITKNTADDLLVWYEDKNYPAVKAFK